MCRHGGANCRSGGSYDLALDTDVICQPAKKKGDPKVIAWLEAEQDRCYTSAVVIAQLAYWVRTKEGRPFLPSGLWLPESIC
jgi:predicted nucleic acid-binding protein